MFDIISVVLCITVICLIAALYMQSTRIISLAKQLRISEDSLSNRISSLDEFFTRQSRQNSDFMSHQIQIQRDLLKKKYDDSLICHQATEDRVSDLASRVWMVEGNVETLKPYIKKMQLKQLAQTAGTIHKNTIKELKAIENELK